MYCACTIISCGLYTFYPILEDNFFAFKDVFSENCVFMYGYYSRAVSNQEWVIIAHKLHVLYSPKICPTPVFLSIILVCMMITWYWFPLDQQLLELLWTVCSEGKLQYSLDLHYHCVIKKRSVARNSSDQGLFYIVNVMRYSKNSLAAKNSPTRGSVM